MNCVKNKDTNFDCVFLGTNKMSTLNINMTVIKKRTSFEFKTE